MKILPNVLCAALERWHRRHTRRIPDFVIGDPANPYLRRWYLLPRNRWLNIYLHEMLHDDEDRALHDHMYINLSIIASGGYHEVTPAQDCVRAYQDALLAGVDLTRKTWHAAGTVLFRKPNWPHRLVLGSVYARTIFITGPRVREWGFLCPRGWRHWTAFVAKDNSGATGRGCD